MAINTPVTRVTDIHTDVGSGNKGGVILLLGISLLLASAYTSGLLRNLANIISLKSSSTKPDVSKMHQDFMWFTGELLFVVALALLGDVSSGGGTIAIALLLVLWLVFITDNNVRVGGWLSAFTPGMK